MVTAPFLPDRPAQTARAKQDLVADLRPRPVFLPRPGVLPRGYYGFGLPQRNRFMTAFGVIGAIPADGGNLFCMRYLAQQFR